MTTNFDDNLKAALLDVFKKTIEFFSIHNIEWWACGGTAIGAVRHKGIIPWDDDVDLYIRRTDYNRLLELKNDLMKETGLQLISIHTHSNHKQSFAKICNPNTTIWEQELFPYVYGVWVDVFILDESDKGAWVGAKDCKRYKDAFKNYQRSIANYSLCNICYSLFKLQLKETYKMIKTKFYSSIYRDAVYKDFLQVDKELQSKSGVNYIDYAEGVMGFFNKSWFESSIIMPFEDFEVRLPIGYDAYLKHLYGDYMTPPPEDQRYSGHTFCYVNLNEGLSFEEVKNRIKNGENNTEAIYVGYKSFSFQKILDRLFGNRKKDWL